MQQALRTFDNHLINKSAYIVVFQEGPALRRRLTLVCDSFMGERFDVQAERIVQQVSETEYRINETKNILRFSQKELRDYLEGTNFIETPAGKYSYVKVYKWIVTHERAIYRIMNMLKPARNLYYGFFWSYMKREELNSKVYDTKKEGEIIGFDFEEVRNNKLHPPTFFRLNAFTQPFQDIIDTYGTPSYKEVNPTVFTIATFPFMFGMMFGDIGHGLLLTVAVIALLFKGPNPLAKRGDMFEGMYNARYLLLVMGLCATYCGLIYNDCMSIPLQLFSTCYKLP